MPWSAEKTLEQDLTFILKQTSFSSESRLEMSVSQEKGCDPVYEAQLSSIKVIIKPEFIEACVNIFLTNLLNLRVKLNLVHLRHLK